MGKVIEEKLEQGNCFFCDQPADLIVGYWIDLKFMAMIDELGWRTVRVCHDCDAKRRVVNHENLQETCVTY
jgi:hypothetical protein